MVQQPTIHISLIAVPPKDLLKQFRQKHNISGLLDFISPFFRDGVSLRQLKWFESIKNQTGWREQVVVFDGADTAQAE